MYIGSMQSKIENAIVARKVTDLAGYGEESPFVEINAKSDAQRNFAGDVRLHAVAQIWEFMSDEYQTPEMAKAIVSAINYPADAKWWLDNKNKRFVELLASEIEKELENA